MQATDAGAGIGLRPLYQLFPAVESVSHHFGFDLVFVPKPRTIQLGLAHISTQ